MNLNKKMIELLQGILKEEPEYENSLIEDEFVSKDFGNELIEIYSSTTNLQTREHITGIMLEAGYPWLRKLVMRDTGTMSI